MKKLTKLLSTPIVTSAILIIALLELVVLVRYGVIRNALCELGYIRQNPSERADYHCIKGWENTLNKLDFRADVCFLGNSLTYNSDFQKDYPKIKIVNLGYSGDRLDGMILRHNQVSCLTPQKIFIMAGCNDLSKKYITSAVFEEKYNQLIDSIILDNPDSQLYLQSILPVNHQLKPNLYSTSKIIEANLIIKRVAEQRSLVYIDLFSLYADNYNELPIELTTDGQHLIPEAYKIWSKAIQAYIE